MARIIKVIKVRHRSLMGHQRQGRKMMLRHQMELLKTKMQYSNDINEYINNAANTKRQLGTDIFEKKHDI